MLAKTLKRGVRRWKETILIGASTILTSAFVAKAE